MSTLSMSTKIEIYTEMLFILLFFVLTFVELICIFQIYSLHTTSKKYYYFHLVQERILPKSFNTFIQPQSPSMPCPSYPPAGTPNAGIINYYPMTIFQLGKILQANLTDITSSTQIYDNKFQDYKYVVNNSQAKINFYKFDIQQTGSSTLNLMTNYQFSIWKKANLCVLPMYLDTPESLMIIPQNYTCKDFLNNPQATDCGIFLDTYKLCIQMQYTKLNETLFASDLNTTGWDQNWVCPYNYFEINFAPNPNYDPTNATSMAVSGQVMEVFSNTPNQDKPELKDKYLLYDFDNVIIGQYKNVSSATDDFAFSNADPTMYSIGNSYGFVDSFSKIFDSYNFVQFYNDTYYTGPVYNSANNKTTYLPNMLSDFSQSTYYLPVDSNNTLNVGLITWGHKVISINCFNNFIVKNGYWNYWGALGNLNTTFMDESLPLILAWLLVKLFISLFWQFRIRFYVLRQKLKNELSVANNKSEIITKITAKLLALIMFALTIWGTSFQKNHFESILTTIDQIVQYECYPDELTNNSFTEFKNFITELNSNNLVILISLIVCLILEMILLTYYLIDKYYRILQSNQVVLKRD